MGGEDKKEVKPSVAPANAGNNRNNKRYGNNAEVPEITPHQNTRERPRK